MYIFIKKKNFHQQAFSLGYEITLKINLTHVTNHLINQLGGWYVQTTILQH